MRNWHFIFLPTLTPGSNSTFTPGLNTAGWVLSSACAGLRFFFHLAMLGIWALYSDLTMQTEMPEG